jgi:hypothetical protein
MLCTKCQAIDFLFLDELSDVQQQLIRGLSFGETYYWTPGGDAEHYYYYILHNDFASLSDSVNQRCHLCATIYTAFSSPPEWWKTEPLNVSSAMSESTPVVMRSSSHKKRMPFAQNILGNNAAYAEIVVSFGDTNITLSLVEKLSGLV